MIIGGLQKFSLLDYPGCISAIIFTQGCNFRCGFCYNPMLVLPERAGKPKYHEDHSLIQEGDLFVFLEKRKGKLDGIVITGGEPTLHKDLPEFIKKIKDLGFKIKLDTNGTNPVMLSLLVEGGKSAPLLLKGDGGILIDYIAMDIKAPLKDYKKAVGIKADLEKIKKSIRIIMNSGLPYEFRTTLVPGLHTLEDIEKMGETIKGADKWFLQQFKPDTDLVNKDYQKLKPFSDKELKAMKTIGKKFVKKCELR